MKNYPPFFCAYILIFSFVIISCKKSVQPQFIIAKDILLPQNGESVVLSNNQFAFDFLKSTLQTGSSPKNKLISPLSIYLALSMVYNGADHITKESMQRVLKLDNISTDDLNKTCEALMEQIPAADNTVNISIANSIWYRQNIQPVQNFLNITNDYYHAAINPLDFESPDAVNTINKWVSDNTQQKITKVLDRIDANDLMFLVNAIYFKGEWKYQFDKTATTDNLFYRTDGSSVSTPFMMLSKASLNHFQNDSLDLLQLPYGSGNFSMYVLLPKNNISITGFASALNASSLRNWQAQSRPEELALYLPKFQYSFSIDDMKPELTHLGMGIAFSNDADFSRMYNQVVKITRSAHKTYINVNEEGTEAAAVTSIGIGVTSAPPAFRINHPFVFVIQEKTSGVILFLGVVNDPTLQE